MPPSLDYQIINNRKYIYPNNRSHENINHQFAIEVCSRVYKHLVDNLLEPELQCPSENWILLCRNKVVIVATVIFYREPIDHISQRADRPSQKSYDTHFESERPGKYHYMQKHSYTEKYLKQ